MTRLLRPPLRNLWIAFAVVSGLLVWTGGVAKAASIRGVQTGEATIAATTLNVTINALLDSTRAILFFTERVNNANPNQSMVRGNILNRTTIRFAKNSGSGSVTVRWYVVEFTSGVTVQRGTAVPAAATTNVTISPVSSLAESFVLVSRDASGTTFDASKFVRAQLTSTTNLELALNSGSGGNIDWQVVTFTGASVQRGLTTLGTTALTINQGISAVDTTRSFLLFSYHIPAGIATNIGQKCFQGWLSTGSQITFSRDTAGVQGNIAWEVIQLPAGNLVQEKVTNVASGTTLQDISVAAIDTARTVAFSGSQSIYGQGLGRTPFRTSDIPGYASFTQRLFTGTTVRLERAVATSTTASVASFVVQFAQTNVAPVLATIGAKNVNENQLLQFRISATDADLTIPVLSAVGAPAGAVFVDSLNGAGSFTWTPSFSQSGSYPVTFIASDGLLADSEVVTITVNNVNRAPVLAAIGAKSVNEGQNLNFNATASDPDGNVPSLTAVGTPPNATFLDNGNGTGTFNFNPDFTQAGVINVTFIASDGTLADSEVVAITVNNVNRSPVLAPIGAKAIDENQLLTFRFTGSDPDGTTPSFSVANLPVGASIFDSLNGAGSFSWTPTYLQSGVYPVTFIASDGGLADSEVVTITVTNVNRPPVLNPIGAKVVNENQLLSFRWTGSDPDASVPVLSAVGLPAGASFVDSLNGAASFSWTPTFAQSGVYPVTFIASDGFLADSEAVTITVNDVNQPPVLDPIGAKSVNENQLLSFRFAGSDADGPIPVLNVVGLPTGASFIDSLNGAGSFSWTPTFDQSGSYPVTFIASDGSLADSEIVTITVNNVNRTPVLDPIGGKNVDENQLLSFRFTGSDPDATIPALSAVYLPIGASFVDSLNGAASFSWTPTFGDAGLYLVTFIASDGSLADSEVVAFTVTNVNQAPVLAAIGAKSVNEGQNLNFNATASDPDGNMPSLTAVGTPPNASFFDNGNGTGTFNFNPDFTQSGVINVTFIASDGTLADSEVVAITVNDVNRTPVLDPIGAKSVDENQLLTFRFTGSDPDGTTPSLSAVNLPAGAGFVDSLNGAASFSWTPTFAQSGSYPVTFIASDGFTADSEVVTITVNNVNRAPLLDPIGAKSTAENVLLTFRISGSDPDGTFPAFTAAGLPSGASILDSLNGAGSFAWTPDYTQSGVYPVTFIASDGSLADSEVVTITVTNVNAVPVLASIGAKSTAENVLLAFRVSATDVDATIPILSAMGAPTGATFVDSLNGAASFTWTPTFDQSGSYPVTFIASDGSLADSELVTITVTNVNRPPVLAPIGAKTVAENALLSFRWSGSDPDATIPVLSAVNLPAGAAFVDSLNGAASFSWTPTFDQSGSYPVTFIASDGALADSEIVTITVTNVNRPPVLATIGAKSVAENALLSFRWTGTDPDATLPVLSAVNLPAGAAFIDSLNGAASFSWTPNFNQSGSYPVTFIASDGSLADSEVVTITVTNTNRVPVLAPIGAKSVAENALLSFRWTGTDPDATIPVLSAVNLPAGAAFVDSLNGAASFSWTPNFNQSGSYPVTFIASDGSLADSEVVTITVTNTNRPPVLNAIGAKSVAENALLSFRFSSSDPDATIPVLSAVGLPTGAAFVDSLNGAASFSWTPNFNQSGSYSVTFIASDGSLADSEVVTITVTNVNRPPVLATIGAKTIAENALLSFRWTGTDPDATIPVLSATNLPAGAAFVDSLNGAASFTWTPNFNQSGSYPVTFIASDGSLADSEVVTITVTNTNRAPVLNAIGTKSVNENQLLSFRFSGSDPDVTIPSLSAVGLPTGASFIDSLNGAASFSWTPNFNQSGSYPVTFIASDGSLADSEVVTITVTNTNRPPVLAVIGAKSVAENALLSFRWTGTDPDATIPVLSAVNLPAGAAFVDSSNGAASFSWTPNFNQSGSYPVTFIASDGSLADSEVVTITVTNTNRPPVLAPIGPKTVAENALLSFRWTGTDPDATIPVLSTVNLPAGAVFVDSLNGAASFNWTPNFNQSGSYPVTFIASDGVLADSEIVTITVTNVNRPPVLAPIGAKSVAENALLSFRWTGTDPDATTPVLSAVNLPAGASFVDSLNGAASFSWTPTFDQSGSYPVTFIASDGALADSEVVTITVTNVNRPPVLATIGAKSVAENALLSFRWTGTDPDATIPVLSAVNLPAGAAFVDSLNGAASFTWTPNFNQSGSYPVTFIASDGSLADSEVVTITVTNTNRPPVLAAIGAKAVAENALLSFRFTGSDPDATIPVLSAVNLPLGASFIDSLNGAASFSWTPNFNQSGSYPVTFIASDGSLADSEVVTITVTNVNRPPVLATIGPKTIGENSLLSFRWTGTDPDATVPFLSAVNLPVGASFVDSLNGAASFTWTPTFDQSGSYPITFIASDGSLADSEVVTITVTNTNRPPVLAPIGAKSVNENQLLRFRFSGSDPDATIPSLSAVGLPTGASFVDSLNGAASFSWTPNFNQSGSYPVTFIASDGSLADSEVVTITVTNTNRPPILNAIGAKTVAENALLSFRFSGSDPDATIPVLSAVNLPAGASFVDSLNGAASFSWTPNFNQSGSYPVTFIASDGSLADSEVVTITVTNTNRPPVLATIGPKTVAENALLSFRWTGTDPDATIPSLTAVGLPSGAAFVDSLNGSASFSWTPNFNQSGSYPVTFIASDGSLADSELVTITVTNTNRPPVLNTVGSKTVAENALLSFRFSGSDPDATTPSLSAVGLPTGASFVDSLNGAASFSWTPTYDQSGSYPVTFIASDGALADSEIVTITVTNVNRPPVLATIGAKSVAENALLSFRWTGTDPDAQIPALSAVGLPAGAAFVDSLNGAASFSWTPNFNQSGSYPVTFIASDGSLADSEVVTITVTNTNRPPVLAPIGAKSVAENALLTFRFSATDADGAIPIFSAENLPTGAAIIDSLNGAGSFSWTPNYSQSGVYSVRFIASDGSLADSEVVSITVTNVNRPPVLAPIGAKSVNENQLLSFRISGPDPDPQVPALTALGVPAGASFVDSLNGAGSFTWTPSFTQSGVYLVTFITSDGTLADSEVVTITVNNVNRAPVLAPIGAKTVAENALLRFRFSGSDPDGPIPLLNVVGMPAGASFVDSLNGAGSFSWTPTFAQSGVYPVTFIASDGSLADSEVVTITVTNTNRAPILNAIGAKSTPENSLLTFRISGSDPDGNFPSFSAANMPTGASIFDSLNGAGSFSWTPTFNQSGAYFVTFIAGDGDLADSEVVTITVTNVNRTPILDPIGNKTVNEGSTLSFRIHATDPDGQALTLFTSILPSHAAFVDSGNGAGSFVFTPDFTQAGTYFITFAAEDPETAFDDELVRVTVTEAGNQPPVLDPIGAKSVNESVLLSFRLHATDPEAAIPIFTAVGMPSGAQLIDSLNGAGSFRWTPTFAQAGVYPVRFTASDGSLADSELVTITVTNVNQPPVLAAIGAKSVAENVLLSFRWTGTDPDATIPVLSAVNLPAGAAYVDSLNGAASFSWTPNFNQSGSYPVTFIASDGSLADSEVVTITVTNTNRPPVLAAIGAKSVAENALLSFRWSGSDPDATIPVLSAVGLPTGASFIDSLNGAASFAWTPSFNQSGSYPVTFIASDGSLADSEVVTITVTNVNRPPVLAPIGVKTIAENALLSFRWTGSDPDATIPVLSAINLPAGATFIDSLNGAASFTWTPNFNQSGSYPVTFIASDGSLADSEVVTITVMNTNRPPVLAPIGAKSTPENALLSFRISSSDPDGGTPSLSAVGAPVGATFVDSLNGAGSLSWTPTFTQSGSYPVTFIASDGSLADSEVVTITVTNVNRAPVLNAIGAKSVAENALLSFRWSGSDPDATIPVLSAVNLPAGAAFIDSLNGAASFSWTPNFNQSGSYPVTFIASDGSLADSEVVTITVTNTNRPPVLASIGAKSVAENALLSFRWSGSDPDATIPVLSAVNLPAGAAFVDSLNGAASFSWTPTFNQSGSYPVTFIASDGSLADSEVVTITVTNTNRPPVLAPIGAKSVAENALLSFRWSGSDPDATIPVLSAVNLPAGAAFVDSLNGAASFSWTPNFNQSGSYPVTFIATDGSLADSEVVTITVTNTNRPPVLAAIGAKSVAENALLSFRWTGTDPDATIPVLSALNLPAGAAFVDSLNGAASFTWTPNFNQSGSYPVTFIASDGSLADSEVVTITVTNTNRPPVLAAIGPKTTAENVLLSFRVSGSDPDATIPVLTAVGTPVGATFVDSLNGAGSFRWTPTFGQEGVYPVTVIASDGSLADSEVVTITVTNTNRPPVLAAIGAKNVNENQLLSFRISGSDPDGNIPALSAVGTPPGASFVDSLNGAGSLSWTPTFNQSGSYPVTFIATDGSLADSEIVIITVTNVNRAPVLNVIGAKSVAENALLSFRWSGSDPDATIPALNAVNLPAGAVFVDSLNGAASFSWTPSFNQSGSYPVTFIASDGSLADSEVVTITVTNTNRPPVLNAIGAKTVAENALLLFRWTGTDPDATIPSLTAMGLPTGASFIDSLNGAASFSWTPNFNQSGSYPVTFIATDGSLADSEVVTITVTNTNRPPVLAAIGAKNVAENALLSFRWTGTDPDATIPVLSAVNLPAGAAFVDSLNGAASFSWTPNFNQSGSYPVTFIASDGSLADSEVVTITVTNTNRPPVLASIGAKSVAENALLSFRWSCSDPDATIPVLSAVNLPAGAAFIDSLNGAASFSWTPNFNQSGSYPVTFIASDGSLADSEVVTITVTNTNRPPVLAVIGAKTVAENALLSFRWTGTDPDATIPVLNAVNLPAGAAFVDSLNGAASFNWTPTFNQSGSYPVTFIVTDGSLADSEIVVITVTNVNRAPVLAAIGAKTVAENAILSFRWSGSDPDATIPVLSAVGLPAGAGFVDSLNGAASFSWTPTFGQEGVYPVTFIASDGSLADSEIVTITVTNTNRPPVLNAIGAKSVNENQLLSFRFSGSDPDATIPALRAVGLPTSAAFVDSLNGAASFAWTPTFDQSGSYPVTFIASDGSLADSEVVVITVTNVNRAPVLNAIGAKNVNENQLLRFRFSGSDPDPTTPALSAVGLPTGASFVDSLNGAASFSWTPTFDQSGSYPVTFIASDGSLADSEVVTVTVTNVNRAPILAAIGPRTVAENQNLNFNIAANDPDGPIPSLNALGVPTNATFVDNLNGTGTFNFNPNFTQTGVYSVTFIAGDGTLADSEVVVVTVTNANRLPVANAGPDQGPFRLGVVIGLTASGSSDPDADSLGYHWRQISGPAVVLSDSNNVAPTFTPIQSGTYTFRLIVDDAQAVSLAPDTTSATVVAQPRRIADLLAAVAGNTIQLSWSPVTLDTGGGATTLTRHVIYRGTRAFFAPTPAESIGVASSAAVSFTDNNIGGADVVGDTGTNYFYCVVAVDMGGNRSLLSNRVGEFDYQIYTTSTTDYTLIMMPFGGTGISTASDLISAIGIANVNTVNRFIPASQSYESRFAAGFGPNFPIVAGGIYQVNAKTPTVFSVAGRVPDSGSISYSIVTTSTTDFSFIGVPFERDLDFTTAQSVINALPGVLNTLNRFIPTSQSYESRFAAGFGPNFPVRPGRAYQANAATTGAFPPP